MKRLIELALLLVAATWPTFMFASSVDGDEFLKSGAATATVIAIYTLWARMEKKTY
jgi:hypothetical protein